MKRKGTKDLTLTKRRQLETLLKAGLRKMKIAELLGVCRATIYNELKRGECVQRKGKYTDCFGERHYKSYVTYSADLAEGRYRLNQSSHGAPLKIGNDFELVREIERRVIEDKISPCAALGEINRKGLCRTRISKPTLYRYIRLGYIFPRITMRDVKSRSRHYRKATIKRPPKGVSIEDRPAEIARRDTFGHWEMDCVVGKQGTRSTILALTERLTRYEIIYRMPNRKALTVAGVVNKLERRFGSNFRRVFRSITVDNGSEFADYTAIEKSIYGGKRTSVYYCHPYTSCERGSNERLNREIRRLLPKGTDFATLTEHNIRDVEKWINAYPREIFGYRTSAELFEEQLSNL